MKSKKEKLRGSYLDHQTQTAKFQSKDRILKAAGEKQLNGVKNRAGCWWECKNDTGTLEDSFVVSYKTKHILPI